MVNRKGLKVILERFKGIFSQMDFGAGKMLDDNVLINKQTLLRTYLQSLMIYTKLTRV